MSRIATLLAAAACTLAGTASAAGGVHVSLVAAAPAPTVGKPWTAKLAVRPASFRGAVRVTASGPGRVDVRASGGHGSYRARLVFPAAGRWTLTGRAGSTTSRLGSVTVRRAAPIEFVWPTSVEVEPGGSLLVVENGLHRLVRIRPATRRVTELATLAKPYAVHRSVSGAVFVSDGPDLRRIDGTGAPVKVAEADADIGPIAVAPNGDVYFTTGTALWRLAGGKGTPVRLAAGLSGPHGLAVAGDGAVLVSDTGNHRILRVEPATGAVTTFAQLDDPRGIDVATDGTVYAVEAKARRVLHLTAAGATIGFAGSTFADPYDLALAPGGVIYVVDTAQSGRIRRVAADGTTTTI